MFVKEDYSLRMSQNEMEVEVMLDQSHGDGNDIPEGYYREVINHSDWIVPHRYQDLQTVGSGAYGSVCSSKDQETEWVSLHDFVCSVHKQAFICCHEIFVVIRIRTFL